MILENVEKRENLALCEKLSSKLIKHPLFMHFCPILEERKKFIKDYLYYYIYEWSEFDTLLADSNEQVLAVLIDPHTFEYRFKGKGARALKKFKNSKAIFIHREVVRGIVHIIAPGFMNPMVLNIYGMPENDIEAIDEVVNEAIKLADENNYTLAYETFSQKLIPFMHNKGFEISYQRQYIDTRFMETVMTYRSNPNK